MAEMPPLVGMADKTGGHHHRREAIAAKVFGAPWYVVDGEPFWGQDRLDFVARALERR